MWIAENKSSPEYILKSKWYSKRKSQVSKRNEIFILQCDTSHGAHSRNLKPKWHLSIKVSLYCDYFLSLTLLWTYIRCYIYSERFICKMKVMPLPLSVSCVTSQLIITCGYKAQVAIRARTATTKTTTSTELWFYF